MLTVFFLCHCLKRKEKKKETKSLVWAVWNNMAYYTVYERYRESKWNTSMTDRAFWTLCNRPHMWQVSSSCITVQIFFFFPLDRFAIYNPHHLPTLPSSIIHSFLIQRLAWWVNVICEVSSPIYTMDILEKHSWPPSFKVLFMVSMLLMWGRQYENLQISQYHFVIWAAFI